MLSRLETKREEEEIQVKQLVIDRTLWYRGNGGSESKLQRSEDGCRCCLGFYCLQIAELTEEQIMDQTSPEMLEDAVNYFALRELLFFNEEDDQHYVDSSTCLELIGINDSPELESKFREQEIIRLFAEHLEVEVTFVN